MIDAAVDVCNLTVIRGLTTAVDDVSLSVANGSWFGLVGANGSGKTSLLRAVAGRLPCQITSCRISGTELADDPANRAARLGFMPPAELLPTALTGQQLLNLVGGSEDVWRAGTGDIGEAIGLEQLLSKRIGDCSAGMRQRIAIGCAFAANNAVVILDEPFNWLDPVASYDLRCAFRRRVDAGLTLITAMHDLLSLAVCDAGLLLGGGIVVTELENAEITVGRADPGGFESRMITILRKHSRWT